MASLNNEYISKPFALVKRYWLIILLAIIGSLASGFVYNSTTSTTSIYKFNSGLSLSFDLEKWKLVPNSVSGDVLLNENEDVSILLTAVRPDNTSLALEEIVDSRIALINKENIEIAKSYVLINNLELIKIEIKDYGDENIITNQSSIIYAILHNGVYTTMQISFVDGASTEPALEIIDTLVST